MHPLHLAKQVAQSVILAGELIALFDEPPFLGPLGVALGPGGQHQGVQRGNMRREGYRASSRPGLSHVACAVRSST